MTVDRRLILHRDSRTVEILWMGRAHTDGDLCVFLPNEKVLATGDALHGWTPTMRDSYPYDWIQTLHAAEKLDFEHVIGGHPGGQPCKPKFPVLETTLSALLSHPTPAPRQGGHLSGAKTPLTEA